MVAKQVGIDWKFQPKTCVGDDDRISQLPDDILVVILSLLSLKEAARASILSSRWTNLWKHTLSLDFDAENSMCKLARERELEMEEGLKYVEWVNSVLQSHRAVTLREFRICFDLSEPSHIVLTKWLEYALARQVQRLEFDLSAANSRRFGRTDLNYVFPQELLTESNHHTRTRFGFKHLKELSFRFVTVTREAIEFFLNNCPFLENLIVHKTKKISTLEVCGSSLALKHLELFGLDSVKVSAPNLTSLSVKVYKELILDNVPMLDELTVACGYCEFSVERLLLSSCISQLESLTLMLSNLKGSTVLCKFPEMPRLKKLVIEYWTLGEGSLIALTSLIKASPYLQEFVLKLRWLELSRSDREIGSSVRFPHEHLKVAKFCGYYGRSSDVEFVKYFIDNCVVLEKLIIDPHGLVYIPRVPTSPAKLAKEVTARDCAKRQLESQVPAHIELVIL
ncbi:hypothetical protein ABFS82_10G119500 [Erythranthe guttata]|uniref:F-box domain-containing protein n=1 Tax=Erythranthe guttata TaxID=4155 RepID=A0A022QFJ9_ERYGU|nr:PREDICTED: F-box/LRR-repeat protein At3g26922-like [Erythranthe guttata]EYU25320.1 hypothetical protein MIMGU_mgv1a006232mg [Erythranthe guttata]|eukprot:XP_012851879.1 PREDICTED: F-box/LRR-repeat protein At3g26922-like [Erythranthe guttata]